MVGTIRSERILSLPIRSEKVLDRSHRRLCYQDDRQKTLAPMIKYHSVDKNAFQSGTGLLFSLHLEVLLLSERAWSRVVDLESASRSWHNCPILSFHGQV